MSNYLIYGLASSSDRLIRYIGVTNNTDLRLREHLKDINRQKIRTHKKYWIASCIKANNTIILEILEDDLTQKNAFIKERDYIKLFKTSGANLVNGTLGGDGVTQTPEIRAKIKANRKPIVYTSEIRANLSRGQKLRVRIKKLKPIKILKPKGGSKKGIAHPGMWIKVNQFDKSGNLIQSFNSLTEALEITGINNIHRAAVGKRKTAGNYIWKFN